jgi:hypothetical protein
MIDNRDLLLKSLKCQWQIEFMRKDKRYKLLPEVTEREAGLDLKKIMSNFDFKFNLDYPRFVSRCDLFPVTE